MQIKITNVQLMDAIGALNELTNAPPESKPNMIKFKVVSISRALEDAVRAYNESRLEIVKKYAPDGQDYIGKDDEAFNDAFHDLEELNNATVDLNLPQTFRADELMGIDPQYLNENIIAGLESLIEPEK